jgi:hypothetical protein
MSAKADLVGLGDGWPDDAFGEKVNAGRGAGLADLPALC